MIQVPSIRRGALRAFVLASALAVPAFAQEKDTVQLNDGKTETGKIKSEDYGGLVIDAKGDKTILWSDVKQPDGISYGGSPEYQSVKEMLAAGKFADAQGPLEELKGNKKLRPVLMQHTLYYWAYSSQRLGKLDEALAGYKELLTAFPKSRYLLDVATNVVDVHIAKKDPGSATKALDQMSGDALTAGVDPGFGSALNVLKGRVLEEQKKWAEAQAAYAVAEKATGVSAAVVAKAVLGQARCAVALGDKPKAEGLYRKLTTQDGPNPVVSGAWNGLGDLLVEEAKKAVGGKVDSEKLLDALYYYLRGVVQYSPLPGEPTEEYERALAGAAQCFQFLGELESKPEIKNVYKQRSAERRAQLKNQFPNSKYNT